MSNTTKFNIQFLSTADTALPINAFIQHVYRLVCVRASGTVTIGGMRDILLEKFKDAPDETAAINEFCDYQIRDEVTEDTVVIEADEGEETYFHFDFQDAK